MCVTPVERHLQSLVLLLLIPGNIQVRVTYRETGCSKHADKRMGIGLLPKVDYRLLS